MTDADRTRLHRALAPIEPRAAVLPWAATRPWTVGSHVWEEGGAPVIDLHDLSVSLAVEACRAVLDAHLDAPAVVWVTGRGERTAQSPLRRAVLGLLDSRAAAHDWRVVPQPGRVRLVLDPTRSSQPAVPWITVVVAVLALLGFLASWLR